MFKALIIDLFPDLHLQTLKQHVELPFKLFPLTFLLVNNIVDSVLSQFHMAVNAPKNNRLVSLPEVDEVRGWSKELNVLKLYLTPPSQFLFLISQ